MCALEPVLRSTLSNRGLPRRRRVTTPTALRTVTFTSRPGPAVQSWGGDSATPTVSGERRVARLARELSLQTTRLPGTGIIAFGLIQAGAVPVLLGNLQGHLLGEAGEPAEAASIECFWSLIAATDLYQNEDGDPDPAQVQEIWQAARLLSL